MIRRIVLLGTLLSLALALSYTLWPQVESWKSHHSPRTPSGTVASPGVPPLPPAVHPFCNNPYESLCKKRKGAHTDPTGAVYRDIDGELRALRTYEDLIRKHIDWTPDQIDEALVQEIYTPKRIARLKSAHRWVLSQFDKWIKSLPESRMSPETREQWLKRIQSVQLELPIPVKAYADEPDLLTKIDVYYERSHENHAKLRVGGAFLIAVHSWFNLVFTFAHELAHSIDPCEATHLGWSQDAYRRILSCSPGAQQIISPTSKGCEVFADWIAVQISAKTLAAYRTEFDADQMQKAAINSVLDLCEDEDDPFNKADTQNYLTPQQRIQKLFSEHPTIRELFACPKERETPHETHDFYCL